MVNAYFISGLGADERAFRHIKLPVGYRPVYMNWIPPGADESLLHYAGRMAECIDASQPFVLIGLSLGGMVATEIAKRRKPRRLVLISSVPSSSHLPFYYKAAGAIRLDRVVPIRLLQNASLIKRFFEPDTDEDRELLRQMIRESDPGFIRWALHAILSWKNVEVPEEICQIHGTHDLLLPKKFTNPTYLIPDAGHLLVLSRASEVNRILESLLAVGLEEAPTA